jgi:ABC-type nitrate/sulfonate/bicarbonate transport system substrate-binding protein
MVTSDSFTENNPAAVAAAVRAIVKTQKALKADPRLAMEVGRRKFPKEAAGLIRKVVERDVVFYDPAILPEEIEAMNRFAQAVGHLSDPVAYDNVVATRFRDLWQ